MGGHAFAGGHFQGGLHRRLKGKCDVAVAKVSFAAALPNISVQQFFRVLTFKRSPPGEEVFFAETLISLPYSTFSMCTELNRSSADTISGASGRRTKHLIVALAYDPSHPVNRACYQDQNYTRGPPHFDTAQQGRIFSRSHSPTSQFLKSHPLEDASEINLT